MPKRHPDWLLAAAVSELRSSSIREVAARLHLPESTVAYWHRRYVVQQQPRRPTSTSPCPRCDGTLVDECAYVHLLGWYLGDGHIATGNKSFILTVYNDDRYVGLSEEVAKSITSVRTGIFPWARTRGQCRWISSSWTHWPCLFPQHGPGRKHERSIRLEPWQQRLVDRHPGRLLRGLFHSDGCRMVNWTTRHYRGTVTRYEYPRYFFTNVSTDIMQICQETLDLAGIEWKQPRWNMLSVNKREAVAALDQHVGPKY
ncbi:MAG: hypothetical protein ACTHNT_05585 [Actinomycetales bacterium]